MATREEVLASTFVELADTLVDDFDIIELLTTLSERCVHLLEARGTGILLGDQPGGLQVIAASSDQVTELELFQLHHDEGPCVDCFRFGEPVVQAGLARANPWPRFGPVALGAGVQSVYAFPMRLRDQVVGTLNLFLATPVGLSTGDVVVAQALAHAATISVLQDSGARNARATAVEFRHALRSRVSIEQAKGMLSERAGISPDQAFARLRAAARSHQVKLSALAAEVVERTAAEAIMSELARPDTIERPRVGMTMRSARPRPVH